MSQANSFKTFLSQDTIQMPAIIPFSITIGYGICGPSCAVVAGGTTIVDLLLKYYNITDAYHVTYSSLGGILGYNMITPFIQNYNLLMDPQKIQEGCVAENNVKAEYLDKILSIGMASAGIIVSTTISKVEDWIIESSHQLIDPLTIENPEL